MKTPCAIRPNRIRLAVSLAACSLLAGCNPAVYTVNVTNLTDSALSVEVVDRAEYTPGSRAAIVIPPRHRAGLGPFSIERDRAELNVTTVGDEAPVVLVLNPGVTELEAVAPETGAPIVLRPATPKP